MLIDGNDVDVESINHSEDDDEGRNINCGIA